MRRSVGHHEGALSPCCVKTPPSVSSHYTPKGHLHVGKVPNTGDLEIYEAPFDASKKPTSLIICAYDIFGFHPNTKEVCDNIALATGARVIMPDFYRGDYWSESRRWVKHNPKDSGSNCVICSFNVAFSSIQLMYSWVTYHGSWGQTKQDLINIIEFYKAHEGIHSVGIFGMCWGGKVSVWAGSEIPAIRCAGLIHPSGVSIDEADKIHCPVIVLPSRDEIDFVIILVKQFLQFQI